MKSWAGMTVPFGCTHRASSSAPTIMPVLASSSGWKNGTMSPSSMARRSRNSRSIRFSVLASQFGVEVSDPAATGCLGLVERDVRVGQDLADVAAVRRGVGDPDADRRRQLATCGVDCLAEYTLQLVGNSDGRLLVGTRQGNDELVATDAAGDPAGVDAALDSIGDDSQEVIAASMAERVVDRLEAIEVQEQHADRFRRRLRRPMTPMSRTFPAG